MATSTERVIKNYNEKALFFHFFSKSRQKLRSWQIEWTS